MWVDILSVLLYVVSACQCSHMMLGKLLLCRALISLSSLNSIVSWSYKAPASITTSPSLNRRVEDEVKYWLLSFLHINPVNRNDSSIAAVGRRTLCFQDWGEKKEYCTWISDITVFWRQHLSHCRGETSLITHWVSTYKVMSLLLAQGFLLECSVRFNTVQSRLSRCELCCMFTKMRVSASFSCDRSGMLIYSTCLNCFPWTDRASTHGRSSPGHAGWRGSTGRHTEF